LAMQAQLTAIEAQRRKKQALMTRVQEDVDGDVDELE
jgi:hypothetical protein